MEQPAGSNALWQKFAADSQQQHGSSAFTSREATNGLMNPPIRRQPSTLSNSNNMLHRGLSNSHRMASSHQLSSSSSLSSTSRQRLQKTESSGGGMSNAVFPMSQPNRTSSGILGNNAVFSTSQSRIQQGVSDVSSNSSMENSAFSSVSNPQTKNSLMSGFLSQRKLGTGLSSNRNSSQVLSMENSDSPLVAALSRKMKSSSSINQQQQQQQGTGPSSSGFPISQLLAAKKPHSSASLSLTGNRPSVGNFAPNMSPPALPGSSSNRTTSILNARLSVSADSSRSGSLRNSVSMSAIGKGGSLGSSSSISSRLFPGGVPSPSTRQNISINQSSSMGQNQTFNPSLTSRLSQSTSNLGTVMRSPSQGSNMTAVQSNMAMLLNRNQQKPTSDLASILRKQQPQAVQSRKRSLSQTNLVTNPTVSKTSRFLTSATARRNSAVMSSDSLLHNSCKLYPKTLVVLESALAFDPEAIRRSVPLIVGSPSESNKEGEDTKEQEQGMTPHFPAAATAGLRDAVPSSFKSSAWYSYPFNIAMKHEAGLDVLQFLAKEGPDVLAKPDGDEEAASLGIALGMEKPSLDIIRLILSNNPATKKVSDRQSNFPLHIAVRAPLGSDAQRLELVRLIYFAHPSAIKEKNFRGETPLDIAVRSPFSCDDVIDFLQQNSAPDEESELIDAPTPFS